MATLFKKIEDKNEYEFKDGGARSEAIAWNDDGTFKEIVSHRPTIGCSMLVGSVTARTYQHQDYWLTTEVLEILEDTEDVVVFKTKNSVYEWRN